MFCAAKSFQCISLDCLSYLQWSFFQSRLFISSPNFASNSVQTAFGILYRKASHTSSTSLADLQPMIVEDTASCLKENWIARLRIGIGLMFVHSFQFHKFNRLLNCSENLIVPDLLLCGIYFFVFFQFTTYFFCVWHYHI